MGSCVGKHPALRTVWVLLDYRCCGQAMSRPMTSPDDLSVIAKELEDSVFWAIDPHNAPSIRTKVRNIADRLRAIAVEREAALRVQREAGRQEGKPLRWFVERKHPTAPGMLQVSAFAEKADAELQREAWDAQKSEHVKLWERHDERDHKIATLEAVVLRLREVLTTLVDASFDYFVHSELHSWEPDVECAVRYLAAKAEAQAAVSEGARTSAS
jgi:hypothetical protein